MTGDILDVIPPPVSVSAYDVTGKTAEAALKK